MPFSHYRRALSKAISVERFDPEELGWRWGSVDGIFWCQEPPVVLTQVCSYSIGRYSSSYLGIYFGFTPFRQKRQWLPSTNLQSDCSQNEEQRRKGHNNKPRKGAGTERQESTNSYFNSSRVQFLSFPLSLLLLYSSLPSPTTTPSFASHRHHCFGGDNIRIILSLAVSLVSTTLSSIPFTIHSMLHLLRLV